MLQIAQAIARALEAGEPAALATVVRTSGSAPQEPGAKLLLLASGEAIGTIGGGAIERDVREALARCIEDGRPQLVRRDLGADLGMCCGGRMEVFIERLDASERLVLFGAGHVARATAAATRAIGFDVVVVDPREELNTEERFPGCARILTEPAHSVEHLRPRGNDWLLVVTYDHGLDEEALEALLWQPHRYLGMIGSRRKVFRILQRIHARRGLPSLERVYAPVGLDIGAVSPAEIAISVCAELVALRHGRAGAHLRAVDEPLLRQVLEGRRSVDSLARLDGRAPES